MATLQHIKKQAIELPESDRAALASALLRSLAPAHHDVSDGEVEQRIRDLDDGRVQEISHEEFLAGIKRQSGT